MTFLFEILIAFGLLYEPWNTKNRGESVDVVETNLIGLDSYVNMTDLEDYPNVCDDYESELCAGEWLKKIDLIGKRNGNRLGNIIFRYSTDINSVNEKTKLRLQRQNIKIHRKMKEKLWKFKWDKFLSPQIKRIFKRLSPTIQSQNKTITEMLLNVSSRIKSIYNNGQSCYGKCLNKGETELAEIFRTERDYDILAGHWLSWRNSTGRRIRSLFIERMNLENFGARENGYVDAASFLLRNDFEEENFNETSLKMYEDILPLYKELHAYVRHCLWKFYPGKFSPNAPIPAHILGNIWAQQWNNIMPILQKCGQEVVSNSIQKQANDHLATMSVTEMFKIAENFFQSIGMYKMTSNFWNRSVFEQTPNRLVDCHGSAHNLANGIDFRIKMCARKNINDFTIIHHEMGHIEYYMAYRNLSYGLLGSANPGFHEAIGDTIALSVKTPEHLKKIGLISEIPETKDFDIDYLLSTALEEVAFLPFSFMMDSFVWSVYNGSVASGNLNKHWWDLRYRFQGIQPPIKRTENDFDPAAKYHIAFGYSYLRYFISEILQFQFYESLCSLSGHRGPLHRCDFYQSKKAGRRFLEMLKKGRSQHWRDTLELLTGTRDISTKSLLKYFSPLYKWLKETNKQLKIPVGW